MFSVGVRRRFNAKHYLVGGNFGPENHLHSHSYRVELVLEGPELNDQGFLIDLVDLERALDERVDRLRDQVLNEQAAFSGLNPSVENLARVLGIDLAREVPKERVSALRMVVWENGEAWASYSVDLNSVA